MTSADLNRKCSTSNFNSPVIPLSLGLNYAMYTRRVYNQEMISIDIAFCFSGDYIFLVPMYCELL